jgi:hypothetical protein
MYAGMSGTMHGEKKDSTPAENAVEYVKLSSIMDYKWIDQLWKRPRSKNPGIRSWTGSFSTDYLE